jgi:acetylornithine deacetylase
VIAVAHGRGGGRGGGRNLLLNGHTDTVGITDMVNPHQPVVDGARLYGRGAYDMKASLAAMLMAAKAAQERNLRGDVIVTAVIDEEVASLGTAALVADLARWQPAAAIVVEPTELQLVVAHKGFVWLAIETVGKAAHGSRPHLGIDAIAKMGKVLVELERLDLALRAQPSHPYLHSGSLHASLIGGGQELSSYPAHCTLHVERRTIPGETPALVAAQLRAILDGLAQIDPAFQARLRTTLAREPFAVAEEAEIVQLVRAQATPVLGQPPPLTGVTFWTDAALLAAAGVPTVLFGPHGAGAHAAVEWVDLTSVEQLTQILIDTAATFCA